MSYEMNELLARLPQRLRQELEDFFVDRAESCRSPNSRRLYIYTALSLAQYAGIESLADLDRERYRAWKRAMLRFGASDFTIRSYVTRIKALVRWLRGELPEWLKAEKSSTWELYSKGEHLRDKVLRPEELEALLAACEHVRDKAILVVLAETGLRIGELLSLRMRDVERVEDGFRLMVRGKTGLRTVVVVRGAQHLAEWLRARVRQGARPEDPLWVSLKNPKKPLTASAFRTHLKRIAKRAGLSRPVHPHMLRHTRMTELARVLTEQELKVVAGWGRTSKMAGVYVHLSGRDAEAALRKAARHGV